MIATRYQRLDYRDYSASTLLGGIESGIRANWRGMQKERREQRALDVASPLREYHRRWELVHRMVLCELLSIRRDAR